MKKFVQHSQGFDYLDVQLCRCGTLGMFIHNEKVTAHGHMYSFIPDEATVEDAVDFDSSIVRSDYWRSISITSKASHEIVANTLLSFLERENAGICIAFQGLAAPGDGWLRTVRSDILQYGEEVYLASSSRAPSRAIVDELLDNATLGDTKIICVASRIDYSISPDRSQFLSVDNLKQIAVGAVIIVLTVYDGESYMVWTHEDITRCTTTRDHYIDGDRDRLP